MIAGAKRERTDPTDDKPDAQQQQQQPKRATGGGGAEATTTMNEEKMEVALDENLHSRQLAVYGREVMQRMAASNVLISGANGLGLEIGELCV